MSLLSFRDLFATAAPFVLLAALLIGFAYWLLDPTPPQRVVLATGQDQGAYAEFGRRYQKILAGYGITVELRRTAGAAENLQLLQADGGDVDLAFLQGGAAPERPAGSDADENDDSGLVSLGSLFYEPVWIFYRQAAATAAAGAGSASASASAAASAPTRPAAPASAAATPVEGLAGLAGRRVNIGAPGSGVPNLMTRLLEANQIDPAAITLLRETQTPAVAALLEGRIDAVVFASAPESLLVQMLLQTPGIALLDFAQAEAYSRRFPFLSPVRLPRGVVDLARDIPPEDIRLIAPTATLVARKGTHPALVQLFVQAAQQVHGGSGWFQKKGDFPSAGNTERPLARDAQRFYASGPPALQHWLPFWLANLVDRMWPAILAIVAALIPLSRVVPPLYTFRVRSRIFRWYRSLREVEDAIGRRPSDELLRELEAIEKSVEQVTVPLSYADELYSLRTHIHMVAERLIDPGPVPARTPAA